MDEKLFLEKMMDVLDCEYKVSMDMQLASLSEWDSLSFVNFIIMANVTYQKKLLPAEVKTAQTIEDLYNLIK